MSAKTTLVLLALLILVAGVVYLMEFRQPAGQAATPAASGSESLLDVSSPAIDGITVRDVISGTQVSATRDMSGTWWLTEPAGKTADPAALNLMASRLSSVFVQRTLTPTVGLSEFGLVTPTLTVEVATTSGQASFQVGDATPTGGAFYVSKPGDPRVYLVDSGFVDELRKFASEPPIAVPPQPTLAPLSVPTPAGP
jgi:hypothetical protein